MTATTEMDEVLKKQQAPDKGAGYQTPEAANESPPPQPDAHDEKQQALSAEEKLKKAKQREAELKKSTQFLQLLEQYYRRDTAYFESLGTPDGTLIRPILAMFEVAGPLPKDYSEPLIAQNVQGGYRPFNIRPDSVKVQKGVPLTIELAIDMALLAKANPAFANGIDVTGTPEERAMLAVAAHLVGLEVKNLDKKIQSHMQAYVAPAQEHWEKLKMKAAAFGKEEDADHDTAINATKPPRPENVPPTPDNKGQGPQGPIAPPVAPTGTQPPVQTGTQPQPVAPPAPPSTPVPATPASRAATAAAGAGAGAAAANALNNNLSNNKSAQQPPQPAAARPTRLVENPRPKKDYNDLAADDQKAVKETLNDMGVADEDVAQKWNDTPAPVQRKILRDKDKNRDATKELKQQINRAAAPSPTAATATAPAPSVAVPEAPAAPVESPASSVQEKREGVPVAEGQQLPQPVQAAQSAQPSQTVQPAATAESGSAPGGADVKKESAAGAAQGAKEITSAPAAEKEKVAADPVITTPPKNQASPSETEEPPAADKKDIQEAAQNADSDPDPVKPVLSAVKPAPVLPPLPVAVTKPEDPVPATADFNQGAAKENKDAGKTGAQILAESGIDPAPHKLEDLYGLVKVRVIEDDNASVRHVEDVIGFDNNIPGSKEIARAILRALEADDIVVRDANNMRKVAKPQPSAPENAAGEDEEAGFGLPASSAPGPRADGPG